MPESVRLRCGVAMPPGQSYDDLLWLFKAVQADIEQLRQALNNHVHTGVTAGAGDSGSNKTPLNASSLNLQP